jgi:hypothetical protein
MTSAIVKIVFTSGHVEFLDIDLEIPDNMSAEELQESLIAMAKAHAGHGDGGANLNALWALASKSGPSAYCVNSKNIDFVSVSLN